MQVIDTVEGFSKALDAERALGRTVGLVPTMGYLHDGHLSLMGRARAEADVVAVTIFVNPLQFDSGEDLANYPRDLAGDSAKAAETGAAYLFVPAESEMYQGPPVVSLRVGGRLGTTLEARSRPGHMDGVATVVAKLLAMTGRCRAYFGEKDYQQLALVKRLVSDLSFPAVVVDCPIVRAVDGLAMSSRNALLGTDERRAATSLHRALLAGRHALSTGGAAPAVVAQSMAEWIGEEPLGRLDYAAVVEADSLEPASRSLGELRLLVAASFGRVRLIDNLGVNLL